MSKIVINSSAKSRKARTSNCGSLWASLSRQRSSSDAARRDSIIPNIPPAPNYVSACQQERRERRRGTDISFFARNPSMQHSVPANIDPTSAKFFPVEYDREPMSLKPRFICSLRGRSAIAAAPGMPVIGVSYDI